MIPPIPPPPPADSSGHLSASVADAITSVATNAATSVETSETVRVDPALASDRFLCLIPRDFAREHLIISQGIVEAVHQRDGNGEAGGRPIERFCIAASTSPAAVFNAAVYLEVEPRTTVGAEEAIARAIDRAYENFVNTTPAGNGIRAHSTMMASDDVGGAGGDIDRLISEADRDLLSTSGKGPIVKLVDALLFEALARADGAASDVHIHPLNDRTLVRYRVDGVLHTARVLSRTLAPALISRIKVMGRMDIAERRIPQDGRASVTIGSIESGRSIDLRISTLPTTYGERVVIRLLDNTRQLADFGQLGMPFYVSEPYLECSSSASGMILLTGPTGSGKTTTLYATLRTIGSSEVNIMTIEDPVEYELSLLDSSSGITNGTGREAASGRGGVAISQSQVNSKKGITFATGLRHILRQDPDIIMVGEIRDGETARIAIQSSLTGHLVFSTLHTNDAASAITRLVDLGVEPYLVGASMSCVLAQRLVRLFHENCGGAGCDACFGSGFRGRSGLFELLVVDERLRELISANAPLAGIRAAARQEVGDEIGRHVAMRTLAEDGQRLVDAGKTSAVEVQRVVQGSS